MAGSVDRAKDDLRALRDRLTGPVDPDDLRPLVDELARIVLSLLEDAVEKEP